MHVKNIKQKYRKGGKRKITKRRKYQDGGVPSLIPNLPVQQIAQSPVSQQGIQIGGSTIADQLGTQQGLGEKLRLGAEGAGMKLAGAGQGALGSLKEGLAEGKIKLAGAAALLGAGANKLISKNSATANDAYRTDSKQRTGAAVGGAIKGAGKGFDIGNKIIPGLGGAIGAGIGALGGLFKGKKGLEQDRKASVRGLREAQNAQMKGAANQPDPFSVKAGVGFNTATSRTKAYDQASRARKGGVRMQNGGDVTRGNFRYSTTNDIVMDPNVRVGSNAPDEAMMKAYADTIKQEEAQYGEDKYGMTPEERKAYDRKYTSSTGPTAGKTNWTFNEAYSHARSAGKKTFEMFKNGKWVRYSTRRADETVDQFNKSFILGTAEQEAANQERTGRERIPYGPGDAFKNIKRSGGVKRLPGGVMSSLPGGAVEFKGQTHEQGGIMLDQMTEVETGETMDKVNMKKSGGKAKDYIFSDYLKLGGKTFAARHKEILKRGGSQQKIQELAKLQEKKANRSPKVMQEGGERGGGTSDLLAGLSGFNTARTDGSTAEKELNRAATEAANAYSEEEAAAINAEREAVLARNEEKRNVRAKQGSTEEKKMETGSRIYGASADAKDNIGNWLGMMETDMGNLPEEFQTFDFSKFKNAEGNFDANAFNTQANKGEFREWYNSLPDDLVSGKLSAKNDKGDLIFGKQWNSRRLLERPDVPQAIERTDVKLALDMPEPVEGDTPKIDKTTEVTTKSRDVPLGAILAGASQLIPPAYSLLKKPKNVPGYAPQAYAKPQLPRVNYNAERAANASDTRATLASIENNAAGPAGMVNMIAAMGKKRQGDLEIATQESRANKQLSAEEARLGAQASQFNIGQDAQAQQYNRGLAREQIKDRREEVMGALDAAADRIAGMTGDVLDYKAQERLAEAVSGETGVLLRERLKGQKNPATGEVYKDLEIAALAGKLESEGTPPGANTKVKVDKQAKRQQRRADNKKARDARKLQNAKDNPISTTSFPAGGAEDSNGKVTAKEENEKDIKKFEQNKKAVDKANKQNERRLARDPNQEVTFNSNAQNPMTEKKWDKMSATEQIEYIKNETPEQAAIRRESGIGVVDTSKPDGTKVEGASLRREDVKRNYPNAQLDSFTNAKGQIIYYPIYDEGPSPDYRKGGYLKRRGRIKRKRR